MGYGSFCGATNRPRRTTVVYVCDEEKHEKMRILDVIEEDVCEYRLTVGTNLLC